MAAHAGRGLVALGAPDGVLRVHDVSRARGANHKVPRGNVDNVAFDADATRGAPRAFRGRFDATRRPSRA